MKRGTMVKKSMYTRLSLGQKKLAPVNMRKEEMQFIIDGYLIDEVLDQIPDNIKIYGAHVYAIKFGAERKVTVANALKKLGVTILRSADPKLSISLVFYEVSKSALRKNIKQATALVGIPYDKAYFRYIVLDNSEGSGKFMHCTKEIRPDETDLRKKLRVLGLVEGKGKVHSLIQEIGAKKFKCSIKEETVKLVMCSRG